jgi:hypothetical protein
MRVYVYADEEGSILSSVTNRKMKIHDVRFFLFYLYRACVHRRTEPEDERGFYPSARADDKYRDNVMDELCMMKSILRIPRVPQFITYGGVILSTSKCVIHSFTRHGRHRAGFDFEKSYVDRSNRRCS